MEQFLRSLNNNYYIFGGMALSHFLKGVISQDWDIVIDKNHETPQSVIEKLKESFGNNIICKPNSFTIESTGYHTTIYGCSLNGQDIIDFKMEDINPNTPIINIGGINYLDIEGLMYNLEDSIMNSIDLIRNYEETKQKLNHEYIMSRIQEEVELLQEDLEDAEDEEELEDIKQDIKQLQSQENYNSIKNEMEQNIIAMEDSVFMAKKVINKNKKRLQILKQAIQDPTKFSNAYMNYICLQCIQTNQSHINKIPCDKACPLQIY